MENLPLLTLVQKVTHLHPPLVTLIGRYWDHLGSLQFLEASDLLLSPHFSGDARIREWLSMLCQEVKHMNFVRSHIAYYKMRYNYSVKPNKPWNTLLVYAILSNHLGFVNDVVQLRFPDMHLSSDIDSALEEFACRWTSHCSFYSRRHDSRLPVATAMGFVALQKRSF